MTEAQAPLHHSGSRTQKRSRSGAHHPCPTCGKKLRTAKAVLQHHAEVHK